MNNRWKLKREDCLLLAVDFQDRLIQGMYNPEEFMKENQTLVQGCKIYDVPILFTTQYKKGLGELSESIGQYAKDAKRIDKNGFSVWTQEEVQEELKRQGKKQIIVTGMESHICILASVRDLIDAGYEVFLPRDCVSSRDPMRYTNGLDQMREYGAVISNTESILFEIARVSGTPEFKEMQKLIK